MSSTGMLLVFNKSSIKIRNSVDNNEDGDGSGNSLPKEFIEESWRIKDWRRNEGSKGFEPENMLVTLELF